MPDNASGTLSKEERAAVQDRARELKQQKTKEDGAKAVEAAITALPAGDRKIAPEDPRHRDGGRSRPRSEDLLRHARLGPRRQDPRASSSRRRSSASATGRSASSSRRTLDDGSMWATSYAVLAISDAEEKKIRALVKQATS